MLMKIFALSKHQRARHLQEVRAEKVQRLAARNAARRVGHMHVFNKQFSNSGLSLGICIEKIGNLMGYWNELQPDSQSLSRNIENIGGACSFPSLLFRLQML